MAEKEPAFCPNCSKPAVRQGKVIVCEHCDASFRFTKEGPKLHEIGPLESRVRRLEEKIGFTQDVDRAEPEEEKDEPEAPQENEDQEEDF